MGIDITPDGSRLYVTDDTNDIVLVIGVASRSVIGTLAGFDGIGALDNFIAGGGATTPSEPPISTPTRASARRRSAPASRSSPARRTS